MSLLPDGRRASGADDIANDVAALDLEGFGTPGMSPFVLPQSPAPAAGLGEDDSDDSSPESGDQDEEDMHAEGISAARGWYLDLKRSDKPQFRETVLEMFSNVLRMEGWAPDKVDPSLLPLRPEYLRLHRVGYAMTNGVFFVSYVPESATCPLPPKVLLRVYGSGSENLLSRRTELLILHTLSSLYEIGPHIMGTFANGRVEEYYDCESIGPVAMRDLGANGDGPATWVARRMRELHEVPLDVMKTVLEQGDLRAPSEKGFGRGIENHIMASAHRPRRRLRQYRGDSTDRGNAQTYSYFAHPSPALFKHSNSSTMSFDSLATSYDSQMSYSSSSSGTPYPSMTPYMTATPTPRTPALPTMDNCMSPLVLGPSRGPVRPLRGPYPGVWRRLKRWTREASKVIELVNDFCKSPEGQAVCSALGVPPTLPVVVQNPPQPAPRAHDLGNTRLSLADMLRALHAVNLPLFCFQIAQYKWHVRQWERRHGKSRRVFCHNDSQYGNLLCKKLNERGELQPMATGMRREPSDADSRIRRRMDTRNMPHHRLVVIDFEYASPNPCAYDIANHFHEWRANYMDPVRPWSLVDHGPYPSADERRCWLHAYVSHGLLLGTHPTSPSKPPAPELASVPEMELPESVVPPVQVEKPRKSRESSNSAQSPRIFSGNSPASQALASQREMTIHAEVDRLEEEIRLWSPATHAVWGLWGIVISREDIVSLMDTARSHVHLRDGKLVYDPPQESETRTLEVGSADSFDNMRYSLGRVELLREELASMDITPTQ